MRINSVKNPRFTGTVISISESVRPTNSAIRVSSILISIIQIRAVWEWLFAQKDIFLMAVGFGGSYKSKKDIKGTKNHLYKWGD